MQERVAADLGASAGRVVDVVALHGDQVAGSEQQDGPVVMSVTRCAPRSRAIELSVGYRDSVGCPVASNEHLAADEGDL